MIWSSHLQNFVGKDFNEFATMLEIDPNRVATNSSGIRREAGTDSVLMPKLKKGAYFSGGHVSFAPTADCE